MPAMQVLCQEGEGEKKRGRYWAVGRGREGEKEVLGCREGREGEREVLGCREGTGGGARLWGGKGEWEALIHGEGTVGGSGLWGGRGMYLFVSIARECNQLKTFVCRCNPVGTADPALQCNSMGACECREGTAGTKCDSCLLGYYWSEDEGCLRK